MTERKTLVIDACVAINLSASAYWRPILEAGNWGALMPELALREVLYLFDDDGDRQPADLDSLKSLGDLQTCDLDSAQLDLMLTLVADLGRGEAAAIAVANTLGVALATDDRVARKNPAASSCRILTTPELLRSWEERATPDRAEVALALTRIETRASFHPRDSDPNYEWWASRRTA